MIPPSCPSTGRVARTGSSLRTRLTGVETRRQWKRRKRSVDNPTSGRPQKSPTRVAGRAALARSGHGSGRTPGAAVACRASEHIANITHHPSSRLQMGPDGPGVRNARTPRTSQSAATSPAAAATRVRLRPRTASRMSRVPISPRRKARLPRAKICPTCPDSSGRRSATGVLRLEPIGKM
jgi:hypothetical protein